MSRFRRRIALCIAVAALTVVGGWQLGFSAEQSASAVPNFRFALDTTLLKSFQWRSIGPDRGGRSIAVSGVRGRPREGYFGATGGGLWKTVDGGDT